MKRYNKILICLLMIIFLLLIYGIFNSVSAATYNQSIKSAYRDNNNGINEFPSEYKDLLNKLVETTGHDNWKFRMLYTDIDWNEVIDNETVHLRNTVYKGHDASWYDSCGWSGDPGYYCSSKALTSYFIDTRNFLTEETIFQFLDLSNKSSVSVADISKAVAGTYLEGGANGESYAQMIYEAQNQSGENAYSILVRIFQELGNGKTLPTLVNGSYGVYNFYNWGAFDGNDNIQSAVNYARNAGWTTPKKAIIDGAKLIATNYTNAGQVNKYLYKFDVWGSEKNQLYSHQYMTNVQDPCSQAKSLFSLYTNYDLLDNDLTFVIPVFKNMPPYAKLPPMTENVGNDLYYVSSKSSWDDGAVNFRTSISGGSYGALWKDTVVTMLQRSAGTSGGYTFDKVSYNGKVGYITNKYLTKLNKTASGTTVNPKYARGTLYTGNQYDSSSLISYKAQLEDYGWTGYAKDGETIGSIDQCRQLETFNIKSNIRVKYQAHVSDIGWMDWVTNDQDAGTVGKAKKIEAIRVTCDEPGYVVKYRAMCENYGWMDWKSGGEIAGTTGQNLRIEAIQIKLEKVEPKISGIQYSTHVTDIGWTDVKKDNEESGSSDKSKNIEALKIELKGENISFANAIQYKVHVSEIGWMDWVQSGSIAGTTGRNLGIEAVQIKIHEVFGKTIKYRTFIEKEGWTAWVANGEISGTTGKNKHIKAIQISVVDSFPRVTGVKYQAHEQDYGWMNWVQNGAIGGVTGQCKHMEAIQIQLLGTDIKVKNAISYKVHVQDIGWMDWMSDGQLAGTTGRNLKIEAIQIKLDESLGKHVRYRAHVADYGWMDWKYDGGIAGTTGENRRVEAIQIEIVDTKPQVTGVKYQAHEQDYGWMNWVQNGAIGGVTGQCKHMEAIKIQLLGVDESMKDAIQYRAHVQNKGWLNWVNSGEIAGTTGENRQMEAIEIKIKESLGKKIKYRVHVQDYGWMDWKQNGELAGTTGENKRIEAIQIKVE